MSGLNKVMLIGRLGADPDARRTLEGKPVTNLRLATNTHGQERTEWHSIVLYARLAEIAAEYLRKGSLVYIGGELRTRKWQDKEGRDRYTTEIVARDLQMLGSATDRANPTSVSGSTAPELPDSTRSTESAPTEFGDDIPF
jgi:single-strand DNA-binding protein